MISHANMVKSFCQEYRLGLFYSPELGPFGAIDWLSAFLASNDYFFGKTMQGPAMQVDLTVLGPNFAVPVFMFQGVEDDYAPFELAKFYFDAINAPQKEFVAVPGAGHYAAFSHPDEIQTLLMTKVHPLAQQAN